MLSRIFVGIGEKMSKKRPTWDEIKANAKKTRERDEERERLGLRGEHEDGDEAFREALRKRFPDGHSEGD